MKTHEISNVKNLIKEIRNKLYEIEKIIQKDQKGKSNYPVNEFVTTQRKRNPYQVRKETDNN